VINHLREQRQQLAEMARREEAARAEADAARADAVATRQKADEAVKALAESEQRYRYMGETIPFGVWWCNPKGEAEYVSPSFCELLDMTLEEQQKFGWTKRLVPEDVEPMMTKWLHCCESGTPWDHEHRIVDRHGEIHTVLSRGLPVRNDSGQIIAFVGVNLDITDRKRIERQLENAKEALEQALRAKDQFVANISHELRTPLTLIIGPVEKHAAAANLTDEQRRDLGVVARNARTLLKHVNDLLDLSKLEVGEMRSHYAEGDMARLGRLVASYFEVLAEERHIRYSVQMPESLPAQFNPEQLQRILLNLLSNAFKFTPDEGSVTLSVRAEEASAVFTVEDSGPGVPAEHREAIFERFRQVDGSTTRRHGGTGLGLAIVKEFVRLHHGDVTVCDAPAGEASFTVRIPLTAPGDVQVEPTAEVDEEMARHAADERAGLVTRRSLAAWALPSRPALASAGSARRCPLLALCVQQEAPSGGKERHKAKAEKRRFSGARMRDPAASITTSGLSSRASLTASRPSPASPTTSNPGRSSRIFRRPWRTRVWSSANRMRMVLIAAPPRWRARRPSGVRKRHPASRGKGGQDHPQPCPGLSVALDLESAAEARHSLLYADQPKPSTPRLAFPTSAIEPPAVIAHRHRQLAVRSLDIDGAFGCAGVFRDVVQRLLHDPVDRRLDLRRKPLVHPFEYHFHADTRPLGKARRLPVERRAEAEIVEQRRMEEQ